MKKIATFLGVIVLAGCTTIQTIESNPGEMVYVEGGTFTMGSPESESDRSSDEIQHEVTVSSFYMGKYEVTFDEYDAYCAVTGVDEPDDGGWGRGQRPVINVNWEDAVAYCNWRSEKEGLTPVYKISGKDTVCDWEANGYRLPTEAEWEYACRAGTTTATAFGNNLSSTYANFNGENPYNGAAEGPYTEKTTPAGSYTPNAWGLYDMHGNVWEWCWDWYGPYPDTAMKDYHGPGFGTNRVLRGGSWLNYGYYLRSAGRIVSRLGSRGIIVGFRLVRSCGSGA